ncbi:MAG: copper chaperone PCu(A)C [Gammaproteobacteria bacterium]|nr:copper chaperone PCu(A)C [Gammaproteobacteria bacterium]
MLQACSADRAQQASAASLQVAGDGYFRLPVAGRSVSSAYLTLHNRSGRAQVLTGFSSAQVRAIEMHRTVNVEGTMRMRRVPSYELLPGQTLQMEPGGYHLMLFGLPEQLAASDKITIELVLDSGDNVSATLAARRVR